MARIIFSHGGDYGDNGKGEQNYIKILDLIEHKDLFRREGYKKLILENPFEVLENHPVVLNVAPFGTGNAGNNIYMLNGKKMATHLLPPATLHTPHTISLLGALKAVDLEQLEKEIEEANGYGAEIIPGKNLFIDQYATLTIPQDIAVDRAVNEHLRGTFRGSGPSMERRTSRCDPRAADLLNLNEGSVRERIGRGLELFNPVLKEKGKRTYEIEETIGFLEQHAKFFGDGFVVDGEMLIGKARKNQNADIYVNGTQGLCLDLNVGSIGYTVSYGTSIHDASIGCYFPINIINECDVGVVIVKKAYVTRAGTGPLPGEFEEEMGKRLSKIGKEIGVTSGNIRRTGPDNLAETRYQVRVFAPGITNIRKTKVDVYGEFMEEFGPQKAITGYKMPDGRIVDHVSFPSQNFEIVWSEPYYWGKIPDSDKRTMVDKGWPALPKGLQEYLLFEAKQAKAPIEAVSLGPYAGDTVTKGLYEETVGAIG